MDLSTTYLGLHLKNPVVPSASPLSKELDSIKQMEDAGASAIVMYSLFEEQINLEAQELDHFLTMGTESFAEALSYFPSVGDYNLGPDEYLEHIHKAKKYTDIPIIGSLNGVSTGGWMDYAKKIEDAGADAIELNIYYIPTDPYLTGSDIENMYIDDLKTVKKSIQIPVSIKLSPFFSNISFMIRKLDETGADGFVLFNRFYQPDLNLEKLDVEPKVKLSNSEDILLPLRWIGILYGKVNANLAATSGIHTAEDAIKLIMAGADVTMLCSALLKNGINHIHSVIENMINWIETHEYESVKQMKGSMSQQSVAEPSAFERANYMKALNEYPS
jgi:dihydroorotate dehydrogenase (fumarate)